MYVCFLVGEGQGGEGGGELTLPSRLFAAFNCRSACALFLQVAPGRLALPDLRQLVRHSVEDCVSRDGADAFPCRSGMTGQFTTAIALIQLARRTQRVAIIPSWQDDLHYGGEVISMSLLFDLQGYREKVRKAQDGTLGALWDAKADNAPLAQTGTLVLEWADIKQVDATQTETERDRIGCYKGANNCQSLPSVPTSQDGAEPGFCSQSSTASRSPFTTSSKSSFPANLPTLTTTSRIRPRPSSCSTLTRRSGSKPRPSTQRRRR